LILVTPAKVVILGCEAVVKVPAREVADTEDRPDKVLAPTVMLFRLVTLDKVVILGCEAVCKTPDKAVEPLPRAFELIGILFKLVTPARVVILGCEAVCNVPVIEVADIEDPPDKVPDPTVQPFKLVTPAKVVILGCEAVDSVPATVVAVKVPTTNSDSTPLVKLTTPPVGATVNP
jgi:hypothetical protein